MFSKFSPQRFGKIMTKSYKPSDQDIEDIFARYHLLLIHKNRGKYEELLQEIGDTREISW